MKKKFLSLSLLSSMYITSAFAEVNLQTAKLLANLPDSCPTPDAFATAPDGSLTLSCPNWAGKNRRGMLLSIDSNGQISEIGSIATEHGYAFPMGLAYGDQGELYVANNAGEGKGSILRLVLENTKIANVEVVAKGMSSPNGIRYHQGELYMTQLRLPKANTSTISSGLYRFKSSDRNVYVSSNLKSPHLIFSEQTDNLDRQFGLDGLIFDSEGRLYVSDFGDGQIFQLTFQDDKTVSASTFATLPTTTGIDGLAIDSQDNLYAAGFLQNQIWKIGQDKKTQLIADYPDNNGSNGQIDQPADVWVWQDKLVISNFDLMSGDGIENSGHGKPYTISYIDLIH